MLEALDLQSGWMCAAMQVLQTKPGSLGSVASALICWAISLHPPLLILLKTVFHYVVQVYGGGGRLIKKELIGLFYDKSRSLNNGQLCNGEAQNDVSNPDSEMTWQFQFNIEK